MKTRHQPKAPDIVETIDHGGVRFEIERRNRDGDPVYRVNYVDRLGNQNTRGPYFSVEDARERFKRSIDEGEVG